MPLKLSKRCEYALRALIDLGIARETGLPALAARDLVRHERIPASFLEQILLQLKAAGYLESRRGRRGGYALRKSSETVTIGEIVRRIDGPIAPIACVSQSAYLPCSCPDEAHCGLRVLMLDVRNATAAILDRYTLADIVGLTLRKYRRDGLPIPFFATRSTLHDTQLALHDGGAALRRGVRR